MAWIDTLPLPPHAAAGEPQRFAIIISGIENPSLFVESVAREKVMEATGAAAVLCFEERVRVAGPEDEAVMLANAAIARHA